MILKVMRKIREDIFEIFSSRYSEIKGRCAFQWKLLKMRHHLIIVSRLFIYTNVKVKLKVPKYVMRCDNPLK